jgi:O-antigen/teichoic acid export membrane protein
MTVPQRVLANTLVQVAGKALLALAALAVVRIAAGYLGVDAFGELAIVLAFVPVLLVASDLGVTTVLAREVAKDPARGDRLGGTLLAVRLAGSSAVFVVFLAVLPFLPYAREVKVGLVAAAAGVVFMSAGAFTAPFFQVNLRLEYVAVLDALTAVLTVGLVAAAVALDLGFYGVVAALPSVAVVGCAASFVLSRRFWRVNVRAAWTEARPLLGEALPVGLVAALGLLHFKVDSLMLSVLKAPADLGVYTVAFRFVEQALVVPALFMAAVFPILTRALQGDRADAEAVIGKSLRFLVLLAVPLALATFALARPLVRLVGGPELVDAAEPLRILAPALVFVFANVIFAGVLLALNRRRELVFASLAGLGLNVVLNAYFIPAYGYNGAASTTVVSEAVGFALVFLLARRAYPFSLRGGGTVSLAYVRLIFGR